MDTPYSVTVLDEVSSTQDAARDRAEPGSAAVVVAHRQSAGRGRSGAEWETAPRAVAVSVAFESSWEPDRTPLIALLAGVAARRVLGDSVSLKWPNDVLEDDTKVAGILVEAAGGVVVVGMGVNLYWPDRPDGYGALHDVDPGVGEGPEVAVSWAEELLGLVAAGPDDWPREEYRDGCSTLGTLITWDRDGRGRALDVGEDGALEVLTDDGERLSITSGEVRHLRRADEGSSR